MRQPPLNAVVSRPKSRLSKAQAQEDALGPVAAEVLVEVLPLLVQLGQEGRQLDLLLDLGRRGQAAPRCRSAGCRACRDRGQR